MASVRFTDVQARPTEFLDLTSLTLEEFPDSTGFLRKCRSRLFSCGEGAGRACMDDFSGKTQAIDIVEVISWPLSRSEVVQTPWRNRQSRCELLSPSEAHWSTTKSFMKTCVFTPPHETGILVAHIIPYAGSHDTRLGRESSWPLAPSGTHFFSGR
jgi:hypothetical protein